MVDNGVAAVGGQQLTVGYLRATTVDLAAVLLGVRVDTDPVAGGQPVGEVVLDLGVTEVTVDLLVVEHVVQAPQWVLNGGATAVVHLATVDGVLERKTQQVDRAGGCRVR